MGLRTLFDFAADAESNLAAATNAIRHSRAAARCVAECRGDCRRPPPATISVLISRATGAFYFLLSIKRGLLLMGDGDTTRFTLIMRWDVVWYSDFRVSDLDPLTLYRANWCRAVGPWLGNRCRGLRPFKSPALTCSDSEGVPDFYLAGRMSTMTSALADGADAYVAGTIPPKRCPALHGVLAGLLQRSNVTLGRYLVHQMDYDFVREPREGRRFDDRERASTDAAPLWRNADDWRPWRKLKLRASARLICTFAIVRRSRWRQSLARCCRERDGFTEILARHIFTIAQEISCRSRHSHLSHLPHADHNKTKESGEPRSDKLRVGSSATRQLLLVLPHL